MSKEELKDLNSETQSSEGMDQLWSILPSYQMYTNTVSKQLNVTEDESIEPPAYQNSSTSSIVSTGSNDSPMTSIMSPPGNATISTRSNSDSTLNGGIIVAEGHSWQETILDNVHTLPNLSETDNKTAQAIEMSIHFTKDIVEVGKEPVEIDPLLCEYAQGDFINGYVTIKSNAKKPIPFEMFYVLFEGNIIISNIQNKEDKKPVRVKKFLEMFDFSASFNDGNINRLITDFYNPFTCPDLVDPSDGSRLSFGPDKLIRPNHSYKRFFTFKIPNNLLDSECNDHNLSTHVELPPSMGTSKYQCFQSETGANRIKDFSMIETSVAYGVLARFIGRKSKYDVDKTFEANNSTKIINATGDEYMILKEKAGLMRLVKKSTRMTENELKMKKLETKIIRQSLYNRIKEKIELGKELLKTIETGDYDGSVDISRKISESELQLAKCKQQYRALPRDVKFPQMQVVENYEVLAPLTKKSFTGGSKIIGTLSLTTPKVTHFIDYISPVKFRCCQEVSQELTDSWRLKVPLDFSVILPSISGIDPKKLPEIKAILVDLAAITVQTEKYPIPFEFDHDAIYNSPQTPNTLEKMSVIDTDNITNNIVKPIQEQSVELYNLIKTLGSDNFKVDLQLINDIKSLCQLREKSINLNVPDLKVVQNGKLVEAEPKSLLAIPWKLDSKINGFKKSFDLEINLASASLKGVKEPVGAKAYDKYCLVPNFQSCYMARMYQIKVMLVLTNNELVRIKIPVVVQK